ncbi:CRISPR-associated helicase Cas3' [Clostridium sp. D2Q-14]|uniref:CRISPR-associated helicase Cas3' n=1 Tax=Anaeromonas gelatinilytica TaxID=2683194 RepID=UPI00193B12BD|nr:CRISPR-associated helicase Cas3' [Anaeromonas gelatinilytica]MBS4535594.1 CRISPR-associated helicase Cas3' [Anaeromonas gelatinilytica]
MFESHQNKKLTEHIMEVTEKAKEYNSIDDENILLALEIATKAHDFGKYTSYFQRRLYDNNKNPLGDHSYISAIFGAYVGQELIGEESFLPLLIYSVILHHHGNLKDINEKLPKTKRDINNIKWELDLIDKQIDDMKKNHNEIYEDLKETNLEDQFKSFIENRPYKEILTNLKRVKTQIDMEMIDIDKIFYIHQLMYSSLIDGDKMSASETYSYGISNISYDELLKIYSNEFKNNDELSLLRKKVFNSIQENIEKNYDERIFSITAPTGTGKTLAGFYAARKLSEYHGDRKIVYALPFTSIIDQNYDVIVNLYKKTDNFKENSSKYIIKHHSLEESQYKSEETEYDTDQAKLLIEGWNSSIIVTTFVQLFESLLGHRNKMLKKLHSIKGSVIILDELQSLPIKYWQLIEYLLRKICDELDCRVITMTATKPIILNDSIELLDNNGMYFKKLNRVNLSYNNKVVSIDEFAQNFKDNLEEKSYLIVCNTIGQSIDLYKRIKDINREVLYLSTNIVPKERKERIKIIKDIMNFKPIVISTQVIEAGVDLDFDVVIRDLAPLDSIIQAAGRCNRNNKDKGEVKVVRMIKDDNDLYGKYVYGNMLLNITHEILKGKSLEESDFLYIVEEYFKETYKKKNTKDEYMKYREAIEKLDFDIIKGFSVIENRPNYVDAFFEIDDEAIDLIEEYKEIKDAPKSKEKYNRLLKVNNKMRKYMISLPDKFIKEFDIDRNYNIVRMPREDKERVYDQNIGFNRDDIEGAIFF